MSFTSWGSLVVEESVSFGLFCSVLLHSWIRIEWAVWMPSTNDMMHSTSTASQPRDPIQARPRSMESLRGQSVPTRQACAEFTSNDLGTCYFVGQFWWVCMDKMPYLCQKHHFSAFFLNHPVMMIFLHVSVILRPTLRWHSRIWTALRMNNVRPDLETTCAHHLCLFWYLQWGGPLPVRWEKSRRWSQRSLRFKKAASRTNGRSTERHLSSLRRTVNASQTRTYSPPLESTDAGLRTQ